MKLVYLKWQDACSNSGWFTKEKAKEWVKNSIWTVEQVGWIFEETSKYIVLVGRMDSEDDRSYGQLQKIPKTWILKRVDLTKYIR